MAKTAMKRQHNNIFFFCATVWRLISFLAEKSFLGKELRDLWPPSEMPSSVRALCAKMTGSAHVSYVHCSAGLRMRPDGVRKLLPVLSDSGHDRAWPIAAWHLALSGCPGGTIRCS